MSRDILHAMTARQWRDEEQTRVVRVTEGIGSMKAQ